MTQYYASEAELRWKRLEEVLGASLGYSYY